MRVVLLGVLVAGWMGTALAEDEADFRSRYGFREPEVYKIDSRINNLIARDVDGDGLIDLAVINSLRNRIDVLAQRKPGSAQPASATPKVNEIVHDTRLEHRKIPIRRGVGAFEIKDVNSDGRADLVYLGDPKGLYIEYQQADGSFGQERIFENIDVQSSTWTIDVADINGDKRDDIAYLGQKYLYVVQQEDGGQLGDPKRFRLGDDQPGLLRIIDLNQDGRPDLVYFAQSAELPIRIRFQDEAKNFGPERRLHLDPPRGVSFGELDGKPGQEILSISSLSDRFMVYALESVEPTDDLPTGQAVVFPFDSAGSGKSPSLAIGDFDGDKRTDVVAGDADSSQLQFFSGGQTTTTFPCMLGTEALRAVDVTGEGQSALLAFSSKDKSLSVSEFVGGRLTFPKSLPTLGDVSAFEAVGKGSESRIVYLAKENREVSPGKRSDVYVLRRLKPASVDSDASWTVDSLGDEQELVVKLELKPADIRSADVNGDARLDLIVFQQAKPPVILLATDNGSYAQSTDTGRGTLGNLTPADVYYGPILGGTPAFLCTQEGFARNLRLEAGGAWTVVDQYNAATGGAKVRGVLAIDLVGDSQLELAVYDRASQSIIFLREDAGLYRAWQRLKVGNFDLRGLVASDFNNDGHPDILLYDGEKMAIVYTKTKDIALKVVASYETDNKEGQLFDMVSGDLNADGKPDVLLLDPMDHNLEIVTMTAPGKLERAVRWQVFEEKTFNRQSSTIEPREAVIADLNGDQLEDIAILVHDRILVYLQDDGSDPAPVTASQ